MSELDAIARLREIVGAQWVITDQAVLAGFANDWTGRFRGRADAVVQPETVEDVQAVMSLCSREGIVVHPQGGNTGLVGGSVPMVAPGFTIILSTTRLNQIEAVDQQAGTITAQAGATLGDVHRQAEKAGWYYGVDIASRDSATIGGTIATNAGGIRVCAFGMTRSQVTGLQAVLPDGTLVDHRNGLLKDNTGFDWPSLFTGSEGTLGVITAATLRLHPPLPSSTLALTGVPDYAQAQALIARIRDAGQTLLAGEIMERRGIDIVCEFTDLPYPLRDDWPVMLLLEVAGDEIDLPEDNDAIVATDQADYARIWRYREHQSEAASVMATRIGGIIHKLDISVPLGRLPEFVERAHNALDQLPAVVDYYAFGHIADGNLHLEIAERSATDDSATVAVLQLVAELGGSISAEHGIGFAKAKYLGYSRTPAEIALMQSIKQAIDPANRLAPGVIFP